MGISSSTPSQSPPQNPSPQTLTSNSNSLNLPNPDPKSRENQNPDPKSRENQNPEITNEPTSPIAGKEERENGQEEGEEEEGECGFCLFMKGGGCKVEFVDWEECVDAAEKNQEDIVEKCFEITANLKKCMEAHSEYYEPILRAEKAAEVEVKEELERHAEAKNSASEENAEIEVKKEN